MIASRWIAAAAAVLVFVSMGGPLSAQTAPGALVAARDLPRGTILAAEDIALAEGSGEVGVIGWVTRRVVSEGESLQEPAIAPPDVIRAGDTVQLVWREGGMAIRMSGRAMGSAAAGEKVLVRVDTQRRFEGIAYAPGEVRLAPPVRK